MPGEVFERLFLKGGDTIEPITIQKSKTEQVRLSVSEFKGKKYIDIRTYFEADDGEYKPTKKGVTLSVDLYSELKEGIESLGSIL